MEQIVGSTNKLGEVPETRPVHIQEICATMYRALGIDTMSTTLCRQHWKASVPSRPQRTFKGANLMVKLNDWVQRTKFPNAGNQPFD